MTRVSIIVPVYNEGHHLREFCETLFSAEFSFTPEFIFIDDGSTDDSWPILCSFTSRPGVVLIRQEKNRGKGAALIAGIRRAGGSIIAIQDADFEYSPRQLNALVESVRKDKADVVYGSRFKQNSPVVHRTWHYMSNRFLTLLSNVFSGIYLTDMETCYKVFRADLIKNIRLECQRFGFEPEITAKLAALSITIHEHSILYTPRTRAGGKKIGWKDGVAAVWFIVKFNLLRLTDPEQFVDRSMPEDYRKQELRQQRKKA